MPNMVSFTKVYFTRFQKHVSWKNKIFLYLYTFPGTHFYHHCLTDDDIKPIFRQFLYNGSSNFSAAKFSQQLPYFNIITNYTYMCLSVSASLYLRVR